MAVENDARGMSLPRLDPVPTILIVCAPYYRGIADNLIAGAQGVLAGVGAGIDVVEVPGSLEVPVAIRLASESRRYEGYVALGCIIRGETTHYETVCEESARGVTMLGIERGLAIGNGILTVENQGQAEVRADPAGQNKGGGAAEAALHLIALARRFRATPDPRPDTTPGDGTLYAGALPTRTA
ncbi:MAG: 6,7-dimethyl-8-ribityllumazine synthase [Pseudomonadota bacterium]